MKIELELWHLITLLIVFFGCVGAFGRILLGQIDKRLDEKFEAQEKAREEGSRALRELLQGTIGKVEKLERDFLEWRAELPIHYVRREDYVRGQSVIEAKLDALYSELKLVQIKGAANG